jgi:3',5'-cyclic AMP phosphodiesterase CpdA
VPLSVLHLTDIHAGPGAAEDIDLKDPLPDVEAPNMLERLSGYLRALPTVPDYVIVSGDTTNRGNPIGMEEFRAWLLEQSKKKVLPNPSRILIVPGNHDVKWQVQKKAGWHAERYEDFAKTFIHAFPHCHIPGHDPGLNANKVKLTGKSPLGGMKTATKYGKTQLTSSEPFILDLDKDLLLFGFNSTLGCGVYRAKDKEISEALTALRTLHKGSASEKWLETIDTGYTKSLLVDAGQIGEEQLRYFDELMKKLEKTLGADRFAKLTKIAVLHHHVGHLWNQQLELKVFESVVDAAELKQALIAYGFQFVLHGHKHMNHVGLDGTVIRVEDSAARIPLCVVSGGTISGHPRQGDTQTFKVLEFTEDRGPRRAVTILEVPLLPGPASQQVLAEESKQYQVALRSAVAEVHDFDRLKDRLDELVRTKCAEELKGGKGITFASGDATIPPADPDLVGVETQYRLDRIIHVNGENRYYDVVLAASRLNFRQRARVYWLLTDVKHLSESQSERGKVILLIGNLEDTPLATTTNPQEVEESIDNLCKWFAPAIKGGWLEVRKHRFTTDEISAIAGAVSSTK